MKLEQLVTSFETSKKLKELGVPQKQSACFWKKYKRSSNQYLIVEGYNQGEEYTGDGEYNAFTMQELWELMIAKVHRRKQISICISTDDIEVIKNKYETLLIKDLFLDDNKADAFASVLIKLLEQKHIAPEDLK